MANRTDLLALLNGLPQSVDITQDTLVTTAVEVGASGGAGTGTTLTKTILDNLVALQDGSDFSDGTNAHTHDGRYYTESEIGDATATSGSDLVGDDNTYSNFTPAAATVKGALSGIDSALASTADEKVGVSANDTTPGYLEDKIVVDNGSNTTNPLEATTLNDGADEDLQIRFDQSKVDHGSIAGLADDDHTQYTLADGTRAFTGDQSMGSNKLTNLAAGTVSTDAVNKGQLDAAVAGLTWKDAVRVASDANLASLTTITASDFDGTGQGVTLVSGDRVLLKDQSTASENGIYEYDGADLVRASDMDGGTEADGAAAFVQEGTYADSGWTQTADSVTIGTDAMTWVEFTGLGQITAGAGLSKTGNTLDVGDVDKGVQVNADDLEIDASEIAGNGLKQNGVNSYVLDIEPADFAGTGLEDDGSDNLRIASSAAGTGLSGGSGSALSVSFAPQVKKTLVAGEAFAANTSFLVRWAVNGETAQRVYKADSASAAADGKFYAFGIALAGSAVSAGQNIDVISMGSHTLGASDTNFGATDIGKAVYLTDAGAFSVTPPADSGDAVYRIGMVEDVDTIWVDSKQLNGIA